MESKKIKQQLIKKYDLEEAQKGYFKGFFCDGGYYDSLKDDLYKIGFKTIFYEDWYYIQYIKEDENLLFKLIEGDLYLYDLNDYEETSLNVDELKDFFEDIEEIKELQNLDFEEIEEYLNLDDNEKEILNFLLSENLAYDFEEAKEKIEEVYIYDSWDEVTEQFIENNFSEVPDSLKWYIDEDKIKNELEINGSYYEYNCQILEVVF